MNTADARHRLPRGRLFALILLAMSFVGATTGHGQGLSGLSGGGSALEITAEDGISWRRDEQVYVARGNALATRDDLAVRADKLTAHYREGSEGGGSEIYRIEADGSVQLSTPSETAHGERGVYDLDKAVMVLTGQNLRLVTGSETITARDSLEYWDDKSLAVARGNAVARNTAETGGERRISANVLTAYFNRDGGENGGGQEVRRIEAFENVRVASPNTFARGDRGVYLTRTRVATLVGDVKVSRGENQLNGGYAVVNLETGVSRLLGAPPDSDAKARVRGLIRPGDDGLDAPAAE